MGESIRWTDTGVPNLRESEKVALRDFWSAYDQHFDEIRKKLLSVSARIPLLMTTYKKMSTEQYAEDGHQSKEVLKKAILDGNWAPLVESYRIQGATYAAQGVTFHEWFELFGAFRELLLPFLLDSYAKSTEKLLSALVGKGLYIDLVMNIIGDSYLKTKEGIISEQQRAIQELSTPILRVHDRLLLLPIVGILDTQRARLLTEQLLQAIRQHRAKVVVIDVTGVPAVDSMVANRLIQTVSAAQLMGAVSVVTGLSAAVSQALVTLAVDLSKLNTMGDLQEGIEEAERLLGYRQELLEKQQAALEAHS